MELKKSPKADLESKRNVYFMLGLVISLGIILLAFEWTAKPQKADSLGSMNAVDVEEEIIPITREQEIKPPPPPPPPKVVEVLNIVDDDVEIDNYFLSLDPVFKVKNRIKTIKNNKNGIKESTKSRHGKQEKCFLHDWSGIIIGDCTVGL